jgi:hypothetical protein
MTKTFSSILPFDTVFYRRQKRLPGPASYKFAEVLGQTVVSSVKPNSIGQAWPKAKNRFYTPANRKTDPAPDNYCPQTNLGEDTILIRNAKAVFGKQKVDILDTRYHKREND